jgi:hypothetical protein
VEEETEWQNVDAEVTATATADQEPGLPAAWTGKYVALSDADYWEDKIDTFLGFQYEGGAPTAGGTTVGAAIGDIFAEDGNVFVLVAPMAWSYVIDFGAMDSKLNARLAERGFAAAAEIMTKLHAAMAVYEKIYYCSFLEVEQGGTDENGPYYYALAFNVQINLTNGEEYGKYFTMYKVNKFDNAGTEQLVLNAARDLSADGREGVAAIADAARDASRALSNFTGGNPWMFNTN